MSFINGCGGIKAKVQTKTVTNEGVYIPDTGYDAFDSVTIDPVANLQTKTVTTRGVQTPDDGYVAFKNLTATVSRPQYFSGDANDSNSNLQSQNVYIPIPNNGNLRTDPPKYIFGFLTTSNIASNDSSDWCGLHFFRLARRVAIKGSVYTASNIGKYMYGGHLFMKSYNVNVHYMTIGPIPNSTSDYTVWDNQNGLFKRNSDGALIGLEIQSSNTIGDRYIELCPPQDTNVDGKFKHIHTYDVIMIWDVEDIEGMESFVNLGYTCSKF